MAYRPRYRAHYGRPPQGLNLDDFVEVVCRQSRVVGGGVKVNRMRVREVPWSYNPCANLFYSVIAWRLLP